jgi:heat shock protein HslJ
MKRERPASAIALLALLVSACQPVVPSTAQPHQPIVAANPSLLGTWEVVSVDGIAMLPKIVTVTFRTDGAFRAMIDCNNARGYYSFSRAVLSFHGLEETERGCDPPLQHEDLVVAALIGDGYAVAFPTSSEMHLSGPHKVILRRV